MTTNDEDIQQNNKDINSSMNITYNEDQWSPINIDGKKYYHHIQLFALRNVDASKNPPKCNQQKLSCLPANDFMPAFATQNFQLTNNNTIQHRHNNFRRNTNSQYPKCK